MVTNGCGGGDEARQFGGDGTGGITVDSGRDATVDSGGMAGATGGNDGSGGGIASGGSDGGGGGATGGSGTGASGGAGGGGAASGGAGGGGRGGVAGMTAASGGGTATGGRGGAGGVTGSGGAVVGSGGVSGTGGVTGSGGVSGGTGGAPSTTTCDALATAYQKEMPNAKMCTPLTRAACSTQVAASLGCGSNCTTFVDNAKTLNEIAARWMEGGCDRLARICPQIICKVVRGGACSATGECQDDSGLVVVTP